MKHYLKLDTKIEPLSWGWYTWPHLISPVTAACNIAERHLPIMRSFIAAPKLHEQALKNPSLIGGPYIDLDSSYVSEIKDLIEYTEHTTRVLLELNNSIKYLDKRLENEYKGESLEGVYKEVPDNLKGMLELVYDLNNHPSIRLIEELLYRKYNDHIIKYQSLALSTIKEDFRPFVLSTPYVNSAKVFDLKIPFQDKRIDDLVKSRFSPVNLTEFKDLFEIKEFNEKIFESFFTNEEPDLSFQAKYEGEGVRIRYFGHACLLFETKEISILADPVISYDFYNQQVPRYSFKDLPEKINYVLLSHNHQDHILIETLLQIRHKVENIVVPSSHKGFLADPSLKLILKNLGFESVITLEEFESISNDNYEITGLPFFGEHSDLNIQSKLAYFLRIGSLKVLLATDSNNIEPNLYKEIFNYIGPINLLYLGMECDGAPLSWLYGPLLSSPLKKSFDTSRTLSGSNFEKAWNLVESAKCEHAYIYAMGQEPWLSYIMAIIYLENSIQIIESDNLIKKCKENNIFSERLFGKKEWIFINNLHINYTVDI